MLRHPATLAAALLLAACATTAVAPEGPKTVAAAGGSPVLTDADGLTLYTFDKDQDGKVTCTGVCATFWPPALAATDAHPAAPFTLVARVDGKRQWAVNGHPLYAYIGDGKPGDAKGDGFEGTWHVARP